MAWSPNKYQPAKGHTRYDLAQQRVIGRREEGIDPDAQIRIDQPIPAPPSNVEITWCEPMAIEIPTRTTGRA